MNSALFLDNTDPMPIPTQVMLAIGCCSTPQTQKQRQVEDATSGREDAFINMQVIPDC